jgi:hypothetical protein
MTDLAGVRLSSIANNPAIAEALQSLASFGVRHLTQNVSVGIAVLLLLFGAAYLLFGWKVFRIVSSLQAALVGGILGGVIGSSFGVRGGIAGGIILCALFAAVVWSAIRWITAFLFGLAAAVVGALVFAVIFPFNILAAIICALIVGMLTYRFFHAGVMAYTAINGAAMAISASEIFIVALDHPTGKPRWGIEILCIVLLAIPGFFYQWSRYSPRLVRKSVVKVRPTGRRAGSIPRRRTA